jgi:hypothetical protein
MSFCLLLIFLSTIGKAYVPSSGFVLRQWALKQYQASSLQLRSRVFSLASREEMGKEPQQSKFVALERLSVKNGKYVSVLEQKGGLRLAGTLKPIQQGTLWTQVLFATDSKRLRAQLIQKGLGLLSDETLSKFASDQERNQAEPQMLGRFLGEVFWVLGKKRAETSGPELWIQRDTFVPRRWVVGPSSDPQLEIWVSGFQLQSTFTAPREMWIWCKESQLGWYVRLEKLDVQAKLSPSLTLGPLSEGVDVELREWARSFYEWVR